MIKMDKTVTNSKVRTVIGKTEAFELVQELLAEKLGAEKVAMVRNPSGDKFVNELAVVFDEVELPDGTVVPLTATINPVVKDFEVRKTQTKTYEPYEFAVAKERYENWQAEQAQKAEEAAKAKISK